MLFFFLKSRNGTVYHLFLKYFFFFFCYLFSIFLFRMTVVAPTIDLPRDVCLESIDRLVVVETCEGCLFKGKLSSIDVHGNVELIDVRCSFRDSSLSIEERVFIKSSNIRLMHLPCEVKHSSSLDWQNKIIVSQIRESLRPSRGKSSSDTKVPIAKLYKTNALRKKLRI